MDNKSFFKKLKEIENIYSLFSFKVNNTPLWLFRTRELFFNFLKKDKINLDLLGGFLNYSKKKLFLNFLKDIGNFSIFFGNDIIFFTNSRFFEKNNDGKYYVPYIDFFLKKYSPQKYLIINYEESNNNIIRLDTVYGKNYSTGSIFLIILFFINKFIIVPKRTIIDSFGKLKKYLISSEYEEIKKSLFFGYKILKQQYIFYNFLKLLSKKNFKIIYSLSTFSNFYSEDRNVFEYQHGIITETHSTYILPFKNKDISLFLNNRFIYVYEKNIKNLLLQNGYKNIYLIENSKIEDFLIKRKIFSINEKEKDTFILITSPLENIKLIIVELIKKFNSGDILKGKNLKILVHPNDGELNLYKQYSKNNKKISILYRNYNLYDELNKYYYIISSISTVIYEATFFNNYLIIININNYYNEYLDIMLNNHYRLKKIFYKKNELISYLRNNSNFLNHL